MSRKLTFIVPGDPDQPTGGYRFDRRICSELRQRGWHVELIGLGGRFPVTDSRVDSRARQAMDATLAGLAKDSAVVIDGLAMGGLPEVVRAYRRRLDITALVHHPLFDETGLSPARQKKLKILETAALQGANRVIATSRFTADRLVRLGMIAGPAQVVEPGVDSAPIGHRVRARLQGRESGPEQLLCVASLVARKGHRFLIEALAGLGCHDWRCTLAGPDNRDSDCAAAVRSDIHASGLAERFELTGAVSQAGLDGLYDQAGLFVLPSLFEGYGMVVTEALARGLPLLTTDGGALGFTAPKSAAIHVPAGNSLALATALVRWFETPALRRDLTGGALEARSRLCDWGRACNAFIRALTAPAAPA
ncbi:MAG: glycosyltransferase family 4 protein [Wenzhouxiangellaceae bacterium]|nr:glycosyltransferase family 4 protein [Wenzhouxiangellaceae bacterium]